MVQSNQNADSILTSWNGLSIATPAAWEASAKGINHLHFENDFSAVLEIRWQKNIAATNVSQYMRQLVDQAERLSSSTLQRMPLPPSCNRIFNHYEKQLYSWEKRDDISLLLLYCKKCSLSILLQFFSQEKCSGHSIELIQYFSCHQQHDDFFVWSIQDFRLQTPTVFQLSDFSISAGLTWLRLRHEKTFLYICRIAPAAQRLRQNTLSNILTTLIGTNKEQQYEIVTTKSVFFRRTPSLPQQIYLRLQGKKPFCLATLWHDEKTDRLLGVMMESIKVINGNTFNSICHSYETFCPKK